MSGFALASRDYDLVVNIVPRHLLDLARMFCAIPSLVFLQVAGKVHKLGLNHRST